MSSIDTRIVDMQFNNAQFNQGVDTTLKALSNLQNGLKLDGIADGVDNISSKFSALGAVGFSAINKLVDWSMNAGTKLVKNIYDPIVEGGKKRSLNLEQAYFQLRGLLDTEAEVQLVMENVNTAVDGTAYGLDAAAVAASQFAASGIKGGQEMENALRGISGVAAMAGSSYEDVANIFTKVAGQGRLMGDDLNRLSARGINAASTLGEAMGKTEAEIRDMVSKGQISFEMFSEAMNDAFGDHATKANETYAGSLSNIKAALARLGQQYYRGTDVAESNGELERRRKLYVALIPAINGFAGALKLVMDPFNEVQNAKNDNFVKWIQSFGDAEAITKKLSPAFDNVGQTIKAFYEVTQSYLKPIKEAFRDVFPKNDDSPSIFLSILEKITGAIRRLVEAMVLGSEGQSVLYAGFKALFLVLKTGIGILKVVWEGIKFLGAALKEVGKVVIALLQPIGDWFSSLTSGFAKSSKEGDSFFDKLSRISNEGLVLFSERIQRATKAVRQFSEERIVPALDAIYARMQPLIDKLKSFDLSWESIKNQFVKVGAAISAIYETVLPYLQRAWTFIKTIITNIRDALSSLGLDGLLKILAGGGIVALIKFLFDSSKGLQSIADAVTGVLDDLKGALTRFGTDTPATKILTISVALLALAFALKTLSEIEIGDIAVGLGALAGGMGIILGSLALFSRALKDIGKTQSLVKIGLAFVFMAAGLALFAKAMNTLSGISWLDTAKGLLVVVVAITAMTKSLSALSSEYILKAAGAVFVLSTSLLLFALTMKVYSLISWNTILDGMSKLVASLGVLIGALWAMNYLTGDILKISAALVVMTFALQGFIALIIFASFIPFGKIVKGLLNLSVALAVMVTAIRFLGKASEGALKAAAALIPLGVALITFAVAIRMLSDLSLREIAKGLVGLAGGMATLITAMIYLQKASSLSGKKLFALSGSIVLLSVSLLITASALSTIAKLEFGDIVKSLIAIGGVFAAIGILLTYLDKIQSGAKKMLGSIVVIVAMVGSLYVLSLALEELGKIPGGELTKGLIAMGVAVGLLVGVLLALQKVPWKYFLAIGGMAALVGASIWLVAEAFMKLGQVDWSGIGDNLGAMMKAMGVLAGGTIINSLSVLGSVALLIGAQGLVILAEALKAWETVTVPPNIEDGLSRIATGIMSFTPTVLGAIGALISGAALTGLADGLKSFTDVNIPENFGETLTSLAEGIGAFSFGHVWAALGALVSGYALTNLANSVKAWSDVSVPSTIQSDLTSLAEGIGAFSFGHVWAALGALVSGFALSKLASSVNAWKDVSVPDTIGEDLGKLAEAIGKFSAGNILDALAGLVTGSALTKLASSVKEWEGVTVPDTLGDDLKKLADGIGHFSGGSIIEALGGLVTGSALTKLASSVKEWEGVTVPETIGDDLKVLADGIGHFSGESIVEAIGALTSGFALTKLANSVRNWEGVTVSDTIEADLEKLANGIGKFGLGNVLDAMGALASGEALESLADAVRAWEGIEVNTDIEDQLKAIAKGIEAFDWQFFGSGNMMDAVEPLGAMAEALKPWQFITVPDTLEEDLTAIATGVGEFENISGSLETVGETIPILGKIPPAVKEFSTLSIPTDLETQFGSLADGVEELSGINSENVTSIVGPLNSLARSITNWNNIEFSPMLGRNITMLGSAIEDFSNIDLNVGISIRLIALSVSIKAFDTAVTNAGTNISSASLMIQTGMRVITLSVDGVGLSLIKSSTSISNGVTKINNSLSNFGSGAGASIALFAATVASQGALATLSVSNLSRQFAIHLFQLRIGIAKEGGVISKEFTLMSTKVRLGMAMMLTIVQQMSKQITRAMAQMGSGIRSGARTAANAINAAVSSIVSGAVARLNAARYQVNSASYGIGLAVGQGMARGINAGRSYAISAAAQVASSALAAARRTLDVRSPSRAMAVIGKFFSMGFARGIIQNESKVNAASEAISKSAMTTVIKMADELQELLDKGLISDPVITPVLDLDGVRSQAGAIGDMLSPNRSLNLANSVGNDYNRNKELREMEKVLSDTGKETPITFNQYNNSPKALSAADIWRQTRNQLSAAKKVSANTRA